MKSLVEGVLWGVVMLGVLMWGIDHGKKQGIAEGRIIGMKEALKTKPPSEELESACLGLWIGEQNKKYWKKENK